ncbi:MAG: LamG domain-containing protein [Candidatus Nanoarchaeia archaeon]|nr:LamG domain-containing protein [Candidatus Nanoarchaeia archaeon]MDD5357857.1 LamG domain-containing protein [Candidatus Nanoarchaeia archaeon]MDD5588776.1 LamG domain-containing protein [Candidatus Nanoarchaeia archaeon]
MNNKKGLSTIIITLILILVSLVAIGIFWVVVNNLIKGGTENISGLGRFTLSAEIKGVSIDNSSNEITLSVERKAGAGEMAGIKFIFYSDTDTEIVTEDIELEELAQKQFTFHLVMNVNDVTTISIAPIFSSGGEDSVGNVLDTYNLEEEGVTPPCTPTTNPCGTAVCGNVANGTCGSISCGTCSGGLSCVAGQCVAGCTPSSCDSLGYNCGGPYTNGTCPGTFSCGTCLGGQTCVGGHCQTSSSGLYAYYPFNGNANDESGNGYDGIVNGADLTTDRDGSPNSAYWFNGITGGDSILVGTGTEFSNVCNNGCTFSTWINGSDVIPGYMGSIISKSQWGVDFFSLGYDIWGRGIFTISSNGVQSDTTYCSEFQSGFVYNTWTHIAATYNGSAIRVYFNGVGGTIKICNFTSINQSAWAVSQNTYIGMASDSTYNTNGTIDDLRVYNRTLSESEILALYNE